MPVIARFNSIVIKMYYIEDEHNPPHIHVRYNEYEAIFDIKAGYITKGQLPKAQTRLVTSFIERNRDELLEIWDSQIFKILQYKEQDDA